MAKRVTLYAPDGRPVSASLPTEITRLRARGYTDTPPARLRVETVPGGTADVFDPGKHTVDEVHAFVGEHPELAEQVTAAEAAGRNRSSITSR